MQLKSKYIGGVRLVLLMFVLIMLGLLFSKTKNILKLLMLSKIFFISLHVNQIKYVQIKVVKFTTDMLNYGYKTKI